MCGFHELAKSVRTVARLPSARRAQSREFATSRASHKPRMETPRVAYLGIASEHSRSIFHRAASQRPCSQTATSCLESCTQTSDTDNDHFCAQRSGLPRGRSARALAPLPVGQIARIMHKIIFQVSRWCHLG